MIDNITENILPQALMIGVEYDLFWTLNPKSLNPFVKAFELEQKQKDSENWQLGMYIKLAVGSSLNAKIKYPKEPLSGKLSDELVDNEERAKRKQMEIQSKFLMDMEILNSTKRKG